MWQIVKVYKDWIWYQVLNTDNIWAALEAWDNISIDWNEISAVDTKYAAWTWLSLSWTTFSLNVDYWADLSLSIDPSTFVLTAQLKNQNWGNIWTPQTIDLPLESVVVSWRYNAQTKEVELTLQSGSVIRFSVADLVSWLQEELVVWNWINIDANNEISVDTSVIATKEYVDDSIAESVSSWPTAPSNPVEWQLWYDTTNNVLKTYDGTQWNEVWVESNTKAFYLSSTSDLANAQAAYDWRVAGKNPIIIYDHFWLQTYLCDWLNWTVLQFLSPRTRVEEGHSSSNLYQYSIGLIINDWSVSSISANAYSHCIPNVLQTGVDYPTPYTPEYNWSPATKKYVDDNVVQKSATAPSNPTEWMVWYDTTNDVLKAYDGTNWNEVGSDTADINVKMFYISNSSDLTTAQAAYDRRSDWKYAIIRYNDKTFFPSMSTVNTWISLEKNIYNSMSITWGQTSASCTSIFTLQIESWSVTSISNPSNYQMYYYLDPSVNYNTPYVPQYDWSPATKKYVDDSITATKSSWPTAPSNPTEWQLWYDTANDILKVYDWTNWIEVWAWTTYTAWTWIDITNDEISVDNTVAMAADVNTKTFYLSSTSDLTTAQAALDWYKSWNNPIVSYNDKMYYFKEYQDSFYKKLWFYKDSLDILELWDYTMINRPILWFDLDNEGTTVTWIRDYNYDTIANLLDTSTDYSSPYTPVYDWSPATKKYVDDSVSWAVSKWTTAPSSPVEWQLWYDTTNDQLKVYDWTNWNAVNTDTTYSAWTWLTLNWTTFSADTTVLATKQDIADLWSFEVVASLPSVSSADTKTIYLLWPIWTGADKYEEWIVTEDSQQQKQWTKIWETSMDLSWYATTSDLTTWLAAKQDTLTASTWINIDSSNNISNTLPWPTIAATAPTGTEWALWYDTTNDVLMAYNWTAWKEAWTQMKILSYGHSTWQDFLDAYKENAVVYCRASSQSNPATGTQWRLAFMAYVNNADNPTEVEFQYYRSRSSHSTAANVLDEVYVYKLVPASGWTWTVTQRDTAAKPIAWTWIWLTYDASGMTISADTSVLATKTDLNSKQDTLVSWTNIKTVNWNSLLGSWNLTLNDVKVSATAPSSPTEWMVWYDTTNDVLKTYDWTNWNIVWDDAADINTKTFYLSSTSDLTNAQAAVDWLIAWKNPIVKYAGYSYICTAFDSQTSLLLTCTDYDAAIDNSSVTKIKAKALDFSLNSNNEVTTISMWEDRVTRCLSTDINYPTPYNPQYAGSPTTKKYVDDHDTIVSSTAPSSPTEWMVWYDTTNDQLKVYDWTNWNVTGKEYNAGEWIEIKNWLDYSAMRWPAPSWYHVPSKDEWVSLCGILTSTFSMAQDYTTMGTYLKMPMAGYRDYNDATVTSAGSRGHYWSSTPSSINNAFFLRFGSSDFKPKLTSIRAIGLSVRCFKDIPVIPTASWTTLYDWSSIANWAWVFYNATDGLISVSGDWQTWYTIMDKNLWATTVYNYWDTLSKDNCGYFFQWWNNYGFSRYSLDLIKISSTQVDASNYWPWNYYSSDAFITWSYNWSSVQNDNLRWWVTWVVTLNNAITNTGVLSINGQAGNVTIETFQIAPNSPLSPKYRRYWTQAQYEALSQYYTDTPWDTVYHTT